MKRNKYGLRSGFTMIELMAILVILGLLMAVVAVNVAGSIEKAKVKTTKASLKMLQAAVTNFYIDTGSYPSEDVGLEELVEQPSDVEGWQVGGYLETTEIPKDGWGGEFIYERYPPSGKAFVIISYGADGEEGGEEGTPDADLYSTDAN